MLKRFIEQLAKDLRMEVPDEPERGDPYELRFEPKLRVELTEDEMGTIKFYSVLCEVPKEKTSEYLHFIMNANLFGQETGGNFLGIDDDERSVTITRFIDKGAEYSDFRFAMEEFLNYSESWRLDTKAFDG